MCFFNYIHLDLFCSHTHKPFLLSPLKLSPAMYFISGLTEKALHENRQIRPREFLNYIKSLPIAININMLNKDGVTLVIF